MQWFVYIVKCIDGTLYTGITTNLERRIHEHNLEDGKGAKYTRIRRPVILVYSEQLVNQSEARKREAAIKHWKREFKLKLIQSVNSKEGLP